MKNIFLILSFVFVSTISVKAQDSQTAWADKLFKRFEYFYNEREKTWGNERPFIGFYL